MMGNLFIKECKHILKSMIYLVFIGVILLFYISQLGDFVGRDIKEAQSNNTTQNNMSNPFIKPVEGQENYGETVSEVPNIIMPNAIVNLIMEYENNRYTTYPLFYKEVKLNSEEQQKVREAIYEITGLTPDEILEKMSKDQESRYSQGQEVVGNRNNEGVIPVIVSYDVFKEKMKEIDILLGGDSSYAEIKLKNFGSAPISYEDRLQSYETFINVEKITRPYARLFCDYMGITIGLFSVFVTVSYLMRDRKSKMNELIFSREITSTKFIIIRYLALVVMMIIPFILLSFIPLSQLIGYGIANSLAIDDLGFIKMIVALLLPTLMISTAIGFFLTVLTDTPIAIGVQFIWAFMGLNASVGRISGGDYGLDLIIRHNSINSYELMMGSLDALIVNRIFYSVLALVMMGATIFIYEQKRKGRVNVIESFKKKIGNRKSAA